MVKKTKTKLQKFILNYNIKKSWIVIGIISIIIILGILFGKPKPVEALEGYSTLPGLSIGYRYYLDMDEDQKSHIRVFGKYKQTDGDSFKIGWDRQTGKDLNQFNTNIDDDGVIFFEQEFKF